MRWTRVMVLSLAAVFPLTAAARQSPGPAVERDRILGAFPRDLDAVIVVNDASKQRATAPGRAVGAMLRDCGVPGESSLRAWETLSAQIGMPGEKAFDELLGRRLTVVVRGAVRGRPEWAVLSEITPQTEAALRRTLRPAPRAIAGGLPVLAVEDGLFELALCAGETRSIFLLSPAGGSLFDDMLPVLRRGRAEAGPRPPDVFVLIKSGLIRRDERAEDGGGFLAVSATMTSRGWSARLAATPAMLWGEGHEIPEITPWAEEAFASLQRDALVATMGVPVRAGDEFGWLAMPRIAPIPRGMDDVLGRRAALVVCESHAASSPAIVAVAKGDQPESGAARPALCVTLAVEAPDLRKVIERGDAAGAELLMRLRGDESCDGPAQAATALLPDEQVREMAVPGEGPALAQFGSDPALSWGYARASGDPRAGWWVLSLAPTGSGSVDVVRRVLATDRQVADGRRRVSIGVVRPARLLEFAGVSDRLRPMRWVDTLRWDSWLTPGGMVEGELEVRMAPEPGRR